MKTALLALSLCSLLAAEAASPRKPTGYDKLDLERKISAERKEIDLKCLKCDTYVLTYRLDKTSIIGLLFWDSILKPAMYMPDKDLGSIRNIPIWSIANMRCINCLEVIGEPIKYRIGDIERIAFKVAAFTKRSHSR